MKPLMKPYLVLTKSRYAHGWELSECATRDEAALELMNAERNSAGITDCIAVRLLNLEFALSDAPEWVEPMNEEAASAELLDAELAMPKATEDQA